MARYIDADALYEKIYPLDLADKRRYAINAQVVADAINNAPTADVVPRDEVAKTFEEIERNIFILETPYQTLHCIPSGFIEELKEKYTKGGEGE